MKEYERLTERNEDGVAIYKQKCDANDAYENFYIQLQREDSVLNRLAELEDKIEQGKLMEINKPFIKKTKDGLYLICKAAVIWVEDFDTKSEAEAKLKELKGE